MDGTCKKEAKFYYIYFSNKLTELLDSFLYYKLFINFYKLFINCSKHQAIYRFNKRNKLSLKTKKQKKEDRKKAKTRAEGQPYTTGLPLSQEGTFWNQEPLAHSLLTLTAIFPWVGLKLNQRADFLSNCLIVTDQCQLSKGRNMDQGLKNLWSKPCFSEQC